ncbi:hypothetical protein PHYBLDRAFT_72525 [Phycomyces blakesleeanus NRRL 1555(-)]|uniref:Uncharacterized protein n=1 Tax=Phycomyces blakesleeanus (strain ATCC 8743b / DSM 1359 / FGSC 10004 / NBRC 33097 / NRRL 1555) TaxID=763407 RepID=A0A162TU84_PHYB8|nr:hypothetical protein PHYBLDRAFT_72525 [Phycomyces blakesleeanus NRRL 1555(-)]OAD71042.1 hypothetical protein PHYBLDRAFT_72525 [Phycomyces blakesleeanus NRRL 1555(-)]|eukprot:XP_018289082.1 hypothetical protein PHYBLDRAFT_72525 [Phycomyces blakesleeanus NRRL 1555(-)]
MARQMIKSAFNNYCKNKRSFPIWGSISSQQKEVLIKNLEEMTAQRHIALNRFQESWAAYYILSQKWRSAVMISRRKDYLEVQISSANCTGLRLEIFVRVDIGNQNWKLKSTLLQKKLSAFTLLNILEDKDIDRDFVNIIEGLCNKYQKTVHSKQIKVISFFKSF